MTNRQGDLSYEIGSDGVAVVEIHRSPNNFFDFQLIQDIATVYEGFDTNPDVRAIVLCAEGKHFCAGANFGGSDGSVKSDGVNRATGGDL